jgi:hypothetical protein
MIIIIEILFIKEILMNFKRLFFVAVILIAAATIVFLAGCANPGDSQEKSSGKNSLTAQSPDQDDISYKRKSSPPQPPNNTFNTNQYWDDGTNSGITYPTPSGNSWTLSWTNRTKGLVIGRGWSSGHRTRALTYEGTYSGSYGGGFGVYGWMTNVPNQPGNLVEYYIFDRVGNVEGPHNSPDNRCNNGVHEFVNWCITDEAYYGIYKCKRINAQSIQGNKDFEQYLSVRYSPAISSGNMINIKNHMDAWVANGLSLGTFNSQYFVAEGWSDCANGAAPNSGNANVTVKKHSGLPESHSILRFINPQKCLQVKNDNSIYADATCPSWNDVTGVWSSTTPLFYMCTVDANGSVYAFRSRSADKYLTVTDANTIVKANSDTIAGDGQKFIYEWDGSNAHLKSVKTGKYLRYDGKASNTSRNNDTAIWFM